MWQPNNTTSNRNYSESHVEPSLFLHESIWQTVIISLIIIYQGGGEDWRGFRDEGFVPCG